MSEVSLPEQINTTNRTVRSLQRNQKKLEDELEEHRVSVRNWFFVSDGGLFFLWLLAIGLGILACFFPKNLKDTVNSLEHEVEVCCGSGPRSFCLEETCAENAGNITELYNITTTLNETKCDIQYCLFTQTKLEELTTGKADISLLEELNRDLSLINDTMRDLHAPVKIQANVTKSEDGFLPWKLTLKAPGAWTTIDFSLASDINGVPYSKGALTIENRGTYFIFMTTSVNVLGLHPKNLVFGVAVNGSLKTTLPITETQDSIGYTAVTLNTMLQLNVGDILTFEVRAPGETAPDALQFSGLEAGAFRIYGMFPMGPQAALPEKGPENTKGPWKPVEHPNGPILHNTPAPSA